MKNTAMIARFFRKGYYRQEISRIDREMEQVHREMDHLEGELRRWRLPLPIPPAPTRGGRKTAGEKGASLPDEERKRFVSYLSTGSFQTIRDYKFRSDLIRKRRIVWTLLIVLIVGGIVVGVSLLRHRF